MPLLGRVRGSSATGPGGRPASFLRKSGRSFRRPGYVQNGRYGKIELDSERINGNVELTETENVIFM